jgi:PAS domain S-box-containing protein
MVNEQVEQNSQRVLLLKIGEGILAVILLSLLSYWNYLLFHSVAEIFSIVIGCGIFMLAWNCRKILDNDYLLFLGIAYLFISGVDLLHTFAYKGLGIFPGRGANLPTQLWILARYVESLSLLAAPLFLKRKLNVGFAFLGYLSALSLLLLTIFYWHIFPACFVEGSGLTPFKKISEYSISLILVGAIFFLFQYRNDFYRTIFRLVVASIMMTIGSELAFTFYVSVYGLSNLVGHFLKIISFYLIYSAIIETGLREPFSGLFYKLKQSEQQYSQLFTQMINGAALHEIICDEHGRPYDYRFLMVNPAFEKLTGLKAADLIGKTVKEVLPGTEDYWIEAYGKVALGGKPIQFANYSRELDSHFEVTAYSPRKNQFAVLFNNVTELKKALAELEARSSEIKHFAYSVVHDLKNPVIASHHLARVLLRRYGDQLDAKGKEICKQFIKGTAQTIELIDKINVYIKAREALFTYEDVDVYQSIATVREELAERLARRRITLQVEENIPTIRADRLAILRVFRNLIDNAMKYGGDTLSIIKIGYQDTDSHHTLSVYDNGSGLSMGDADIIFKRFRRGGDAHFPDKNIEGLGLGLAIVKEIVFNHDGEAWLESGADQGVTFFFSISKNL